MGKVLNAFGYGYPGAVTRSVDDIVISVRNASETDIPFGAPVFMTENGAVPFNLETPQDFTSFLGFAVRVADKTPDTYPAGQFSDPQEGAWHPGDVMEVLVRGGIAVRTAASGVRGGKVYLRKSDGQLTADPGEEGTTVLLENVRIRNPRLNPAACGEVIVNKRNLI